MSSSENYDGKVTDEQVQQLEAKRQAYENSKGSADEDNLREEYQLYANGLLIDLSGKLDPGQDQEAGGGEGGKPSDDKDRFGIAKIYTDKPGGRYDTKWVLEEKRRNYASGKPSEDSVEYTCIADSNERNSDVEVTIYQKINSFKTKEADSISLKLTGPPHKDGAGSWVIPEFMTDCSAKKTLEVEIKHPKNTGINPKPLVKIGGDTLVKQWIGYKGITWVKGDVRYVESWIHFPVKDIDQIATDQGSWRQYIPRTKVPKECTQARGKLVTSRLDGVKKGDPPNYKYASVREIEPPA